MPPFSSIFTENPIVKALIRLDDIPLRESQAHLEKRITKSYLVKRELGYSRFFCSKVILRFTPHVLLYEFL